MLLLLPKYEISQSSRKVTGLKDFVHVNLHLKTIDQNSVQVSHAAKKLKAKYQPYVNKLKLWLQH